MNLAYKLSRAFKAVIEAQLALDITDATIRPTVYGHDSTDRCLVPCVRVMVSHGSEEPRGSGNWLMDVEIAVETKSDTNDELADDMSARHQANFNSVAGRCMSAEIEDALNAAGVDELHVFSMTWGPYASNNDDRKFGDSISGQAYCMNDAAA